MKEIIYEDGHLFVKWNAFRVKGFLNILRCHKCYSYVHIMRECSVKEMSEML